MAIGDLECNDRLAWSKRRVCASTGFVRDALFDTRPSSTSHRRRTSTATHAACTMQGHMPTPATARAT
eukprot:10507943-Alexandrium_andersonii.AAC.1